MSKDKFNSWENIEVFDEIDDGIWDFVQLAGRKLGVKNIDNTEFTNEQIMEVRNMIVGYIEDIEHYREEE